MFWTAIVWGLGVSFGSAVGLIAFFAAFMVLEFIGGRTKAKADLLDMNKQSLDALINRNSLSQMQIEQIALLTEAVERLGIQPKEGE